MINAQLNRFFSITPPQAIVNNASWTTGEIDTLGFDYIQIYVYLGAVDAALTALAVTESDTSGSNHSNVTGLVYGTSTDISGSTSTLPSATSDNNCFLFEIDMRGRRRYLDLTATIASGATGGFLCAWGLGWRAEDFGTTATERNFGNILRVPVA